MVANAGIAPHASFVDSTSSYPFNVRTYRPSITATVSQLDALYAVNVKGVFLCLKHAARQMIKQGRGGRLIGQSQYLPVFEITSDVFISTTAASSAAGKQGLSRRFSCHRIRFTNKVCELGIPYLCGYSASKFAVRGLIQTAGTCHSYCRPSPTTHIVR